MSIRILEIDLSKKNVQVIDRSDLSFYLGGIGLATKLFSEHADPGKDPLDPAQPVVLACGPLSTIFPMATKAVAVFRSPLTGGWGESYAGLRIALAMRLSGFMAIIIHGKADRPAYLTIGPNGVKFKDASALWGLPIDETGRILRKLAPGRGFRSCLRIGPAGEKKVTFANVNVDTYRHFGRLGLGAVFGAKMLKAMVIYGDSGESIADLKRYRRIYDRIYKAAVHTDIMEKYHGLGTSGNVTPLNALGALPTRNLQQSVFEHAQAISGEAFANDSLVRKVACSGCPVGCIHIGVRRRLFGHGYDYESAYLSYDHELIFALGSFLGMSDQERIYDLIEAVELAGFDAISAGVLLGWLTEAQEKGVISKEDLGVELAYDHVDGYLTVLQNLVQQPNELYRTLSLGTSRAAEKLGGGEYALTLGKNEIAGYHTGYANILGLSYGARHSHLDNAGYSIDQKAARFNYSEEQVVDELISEEKWRNVLNSLCICLFAREVYTRENILEALGSTGIEISGGQLDQVGEDVFRMKNELRLKLGFQPQGIHAADRFFETPALSKTLKRDVLARMSELYRSKAGL